MDTEKYKSQIFTDGEVLTADSMNNIISGINEALSNIEDIDETITPAINTLNNEMSNANNEINILNTKVPDAPTNDGQYFLSTTTDTGITSYHWTKADPTPLYRDPDDDGNIIIGEDDPPAPT